MANVKKLTPAERLQRIEEYQKAYKKAHRDENIAYQRNRRAILKENTLNALNKESIDKESIDKDISNL